MQTYGDDLNALLKVKKIYLIHMWTLEGDKGSYAPPELILAQPPPSATRKSS